MRSNEIEQLSEFDLQSPYSFGSMQNFDRWQCVRVEDEPAGETHEIVVCPLLGVGAPHALGGELDVEDDAGSQLGVLLSIDGLEVQLEQASPFVFAAYLIDANAAEAEAALRTGHGRHRFSRAYLALAKANAADYMENYYEGSPVWGGFVHEEWAPNAQPATTSTTSTIVAQTGISVTLPPQRSALAVAAAIDDAMLRFLKLYHVLELVVDLDVVGQIRTLADDLFGIEQVMSRYSGQDLPGLKNLLLRRCVDVGPIEAQLLELSAHPLVADQLLFHHKKNGAPIKTFSELSGYLQQGSFQKQVRNLTRAENEARHRELIANFAAFCLFRVRCSVAHNRIGEYLMTDRDTPFVLGFAEPLIREVLVQVLQEDKQREWAALPVSHQLAQSIRANAAQNGEELESYLLRVLADEL